MTYDVIILGVGAMGAAAADQLSRRGLRVLGLEQFSIPNNLASSHGESRMIRMAYFEHPDYVPLLRRAYELWHELESRADEKLLHLTGGLYMGPANSELISGSLRAAREHGLAHELLDHSALRERFIPFQLPDNHVGLLEPLAGFLEPEKCISAFARLARANGADLRERVVVRRWISDGDCIRVETDQETFTASRLLISAGAWISKIVPTLSVKLQVTRQSLAWFAPNDSSTFALENFPVWAIDRPAGGIYYGFPRLNDAAFLKLAIHSPGEPTDPDHVERSMRADEMNELSRFVDRHLPAAGPLREYRVCLYTNSPDGHFIVDSLPDDPNVTIACGFSGHGFKFASVMGEVLADRVMHKAANPAARFLSLKRFAHPS